MFPLEVYFSGATECAFHIFLGPSGQLASVCAGSAEFCDKHLPSALPFYSTAIMRFLTPLLSYCRYWDKEVLRAKKDAQKPSLTKAIIKCYWKSYLILGIFTLIEVNVSHVVAAVSEWV